MNLLIGSVGLFAVACVSYVGAGLFARFNIIMFVIQMSAILIGVLSYMFRDTHLDNIDMTDVCNSNYPFASGSSLNLICKDGHENATYSAEVNGLNWDNLKDAWDFGYDYAMDDVACGGTTCNFHAVFAIVFPAATGIMEGANLSGDLKDPSYSIPVGTLLAVGFAIITYIVLIFTIGASFPRDSLRFDMNSFQDATWGAGYPLFIGIVISSLSSALGSLFAAPEFCRLWQ